MLCIAMGCKNVRLVVSTRGPETQNEGAIQGAQRDTRLQHPNRDACEFDAYARTSFLVTLSQQHTVAKGYKHRIDEAEMICSRSSRRTRRSRYGCQVGLTCKIKLTSWCSNGARQFQVSKSGCSERCLHVEGGKEKRHTCCWDRSFRNLSVPCCGHGSAQKRAAKFIRCWNLHNTL